MKPSHKKSLVFISWTITEIMFGVFTLYSSWGAGNVTEDPESSDQSSSLSSQHIFHILKSRERDTRLKITYSTVTCIQPDSNMLQSRYNICLSSSDLSVKLCIPKRYTVYLRALRYKTYSGGWKLKTYLHTKV